MIYNESDVTEKKKCPLQNLLQLLEFEVISNQQIKTPSPTYHQNEPSRCYALWM